MIFNIDVKYLLWPFCNRWLQVFLLICYEWKFKYKRRNSNIYFYSIGRRLFRKKTFMQKVYQKGWFEKRPLLHISVNDRSRFRRGLEEWPGMCLYGESAILLALKYPFNNYLRGSFVACCKAQFLFLSNIPSFSCGCSISQLSSWMAFIYWTYILYLYYYFPLGVKQ